MKSPIKKPLRPAAKASPADIAQTSARLGDYPTARKQLLIAIEAEPKNAMLRLALALVHEKLGEPAEMAVRLTEALRLKPTLADAARWLSALAGSFRLSTAAKLDPVGLKAALACELADQQVLTVATFDQLMVHGPLGPVLKEIVTEGVEVVARGLISKRTGELLKDDLFLAALESGHNADPRIEHVLTALRRLMLLELPAERFEDKSVNQFAIALVGQLHLNEHVFAVTPEERDRVEQLKHDRGAANRALLLALYLPVDELMAVVDLESVRPKALREKIAAVLAQQEELAAIEAKIATARQPGATGEAAAAGSRRSGVRWRGLQSVTPGLARSTLIRYAGADRLTFMEAPFDVLVVGCGTGKATLQAAMGYGPTARLTAIDVSRSNLAYATQKAKAFGIANVAFVEAAPADAGKLGKSFDIIEAVGLLANLDDPFAGWDTLLGVLKPHGLMQMVLPAKAARQVIDDIGQRPGLPERTATLDEVRDFRSQLLGPATDVGKAPIHRIGEFYTTSEAASLFQSARDPAFTLPQIKAFLETHRLTFLGFILDQDHHRHFSMAFPRTRFPGSLDEWASHEAAHPAFFQSMYRFWVQRT